MKRLALFGIALGALLFAGCQGAKETGKTEIEFWTMQLTPGYTDYVEDLISRYEAQNPTVTIKWVDVPWTSLEPRLLTAISSRSVPDVVNLSPDLMLKFAQNNQLVRVDDYVTPEQREPYFPRIWKSNSYQGVVYGIPWYLATDVLMCNGELFEEAGVPVDTPIRTFEDLARIGRTVKEKTGKYMFMMAWGEPGRFKGHLYSYLGVPLVNEDLSAAFNTPRAAQELRFWKQLIDEGIIPRESLTEEHQKTTEFFTSGRIAVIQNGPQFLFRIKEANLRIYEKTHVQPALKGVRESIDLAIQNLVIPKMSSNIEEAIRFSLFVTNAENQLAFCKRVTIFPSIIKAAEDPYFTSEEGNTPEDVARRIAAAQLSLGERTLEPFPNISEMDRITTTMLQEVCFGKLEPEEALQRAEQKWNDSVEDLKRQGRIQ